jgi:hypothetical protein
VEAIAIATDAQGRPPDIIASAGAEPDLAELLPVALDRHWLVIAPPETVAAAVEPEPEDSECPAWLLPDPLPASAAAPSAGLAARRRA